MNEKQKQEGQDQVDLMEPVIIQEHYFAPSVKQCGLGPLSGSGDTENSNSALTEPAL